MIEKTMGKILKLINVIIVCLIIIFLICNYVYPFFNGLELTDNGILMIDENKKDNSSSYDEVSSLNNNTGTIKSRLEELSKKDSRVNEIIGNYDDYPVELLDMLSRNIEMLDFVLEYPDKSGNVYANTVGNFEENTIPLLLQWDRRWGYASYGEDSIAISGCAPTALSMVIVGLTGDSSITPYVVSKYAEENGFYLKGTGTSWSLMTTGSSHFGIKGKEIPLSKNNVMNALKSGHPVICSVRKGDFTTLGHFIVLAGIENDKIKVNDPNSKARSNLLWDYDRLEGQIKNLWEFSL